ncbi:hypothetical protein ACOMHN_026454 [Nucella lapillus]
MTRITRLLVLHTKQSDNAVNLCTVAHRWSSKWRMEMKDGGGGWKIEVEDGGGRWRWKMEVEDGGGGGRWKMET